LYSLLLSFLLGVARELLVGGSDGDLL
jgi:hypothetical protein